MKNNEMMKKMENGERVIGMLRHVIIGLRYRSRECTPSWAGDDEEEYVKWKGYPISEALWEPEQAFSDDGNMLSLYKR